MKKLLWVGDAACPSGFARATHETLEYLRQQYDVTVLGINYRGDPHQWPYPIYAAAVGGDGFGVGRLIWMCDLVKPDVIVLQNDPWNIPFYTKQLQKFPEYANIPVVAALAVDGKNLQGSFLDGIAHAIFWTQFALDEARAGGYEGPASVIPLGIDLTTYYPMDRAEARKAVGLNQTGSAFIVGNVNRNQPRKRWDLTIKYFAEWIRKYKINDAYLFLHVAPTGDTGVDVKQLTDYYGVKNRLLLHEPEIHYGVPDEALRAIYNSFDLYLTTTQGEGMGLTTLEAMACGIPCVTPDWAALGDWAKGAAWMVPCTSTVIGPPYVNVIGGVMDEDQTIKALQALYANPHYRENNSKAGLERAEETRFEWKTIGQQWLRVMGDVLAPKLEERSDKPEGTQNRPALLSL